MRGDDRVGEADGDSWERPLIFKSTEIAVTSRNRPHSHEFDGSTPLRHKTVLIRANLRIETMGIADRPDIARAIDGLGVIRSVVLFTAKTGDDGLVGEVVMVHDEILGFRVFW